jgi:Ni/Co efflux regulator RcnB
MKKFLLLAVIAVSFVSGAFASTGSSASNKAAAHLEAHYTGAASATWTHTADYEKASITAGAEQVDVYYDVYGDLIGSTKTMAFDKLPKAALATLTTTYTFPEYQLTDCISFTDADSLTNYFVSFDQDGETVILSISANGTISTM